VIEKGSGMVRVAVDKPRGAQSGRRDVNNVSVVWIPLYALEQYDGTGVGSVFSPKFADTDVWERDVIGGKDDESLLAGAGVTDEEAETNGTKNEIAVN
jgi:hypothetical protein